MVDLGLVVGIVDYVYVYILWYCVVGDGKVGVGFNDGYCFILAVV